jgi:hypothetical protein
LSPRKKFVDKLQDLLIPHLRTITGSLQLTVALSWCQDSLLRLHLLSFSLRLKDGEKCPANLPGIVLAWLWRRIAENSLRDKNQIGLLGKMVVA